MDAQVPILRGFLAEVACKEAVQEETENSFNGEFSRLKRQSTKIRTDKVFPTKAADKQENVKKNRYKDIVPFDHSRVRLTLNVSSGDSDYINASFIKGVSGQKAYIATQGPLPHTVLDFWRMLWQYEVQVLVMACREFEMGRKKCERYWPANTEDVFVCEPFTVICVSEEDKGDYVTRVLNVTYQSASHTIKQLHYMNWPDHGVPDSIPPILELLQEMHGYQDHEDIPICIHCSAGCGRTGALCAIDYTWNLLKRHAIPQNFSVFDLVQDMRTQRPSVVQTKEQYVLVYRAIKFLFEHHLEALGASGSPEQESPPSPITPDLSSDLSDLSETEMEPDMEPEPRPVQPVEQTNHVLCMDVPVTNTHLLLEEPEPKPRSARRPEDIKRAMAVKLPQKPRTPTHTPNTHTQSISQTPHTHTPDTHTQSIIQTPHKYTPDTHTQTVSQTPHAHTPSHMNAPSNQTPSTAHTPLTHSIHIGITPCDNYTHAAPCHQTAHTQIPQQDSPTQPAIPVTHTPHLVQVPLVQQLTHTQQRAHVVHTSLSPPPHTPHSQGTQWGVEVCADARPRPPDLCVTVEDPYFSPVSSPVTEESPSSLEPPQLSLNDLPLLQCLQPLAVVTAPASDDDEPPSVPHRTPESFILATHTEPRPQEGPTPAQKGDPPSPVPPLPERTPESFELASPDDLEKLKHADSVGKIGLSSECLGNTHTSADVERSWSRSKSLKVRVSLSESPRSLTPPLPERTPESFIVPTDEEVSRLTQTLLAIQPSDAVGDPPSPVPPIPERTPESFELPLADVPSLIGTALPENKRRSMLCLRDVVPRGDTQRPPRCTSAIFLPGDKSLSLPRSSALCPPGNAQLAPYSAAAPWEPGDRQWAAQRCSATPLAGDALQQLAPLTGSPCRAAEAQAPPVHRIGCSSEWAGPTQPKAQDPFMNRSKSVKIKSSKPAPLSVIAPNVAISAEAQGATAVQQEAGATGNAGTAEDSGRAMTRKKSWRRFISKNKQKPAPPPAALPPPYGATTGFRWVFGQRFGKPKGPRTRPETWV